MSSVPGPPSPPQTPNGADVGLISLGTAANSAAASLTLILEDGVPLGSTVVVFLGETEISSISVVSDSAFNTWHAGAAVANSSNSIKLTLYTTVTVAIPRGGTITAQWSTSSAKQMAAYALTGIVALDQAPAGSHHNGTDISLTTGLLAQEGNEIALFASLENNGEADGTFTESVAFTSLDTINASAAMYTAYALPYTSAAVTYDPSFGIQNDLLALGIVYRGAAPIPKPRRMTSRIRGIPQPRPRRIQIVGTQMYTPEGLRFWGRGANWNKTTDAINDAPYLASMGGQVARLEIGFWIDGSNPPCSIAPFNGSPGVNQAGNEGFDPNSPATGFLKASALAFLQDEVAQCLAAGIWPSIGIHGADCNFGTYTWPQDGTAAAGQTILSLFRQAWRYLVSLFKNVDGIFCYEILAEPHPTGNPQNNGNTPPTSTLGPGVAWLYNTILTDIREADVWTPVAVGPGKTYNPRNLAQLMPYILPQFRGLLLAYTNLFELGSGYKSPQQNGGYVKQPNSWPGWPNGTNYTGYPGKYFDNKGDDPQAGGSYPGKGTQVWMDKDFLRGLMNVAHQDSITFDIPLIFDQFGGPSGGINYIARDGMPGYLNDLCALMIEIEAGGIYWDQRSASGGSVPPHGNNDGFVWQDTDGSIHYKTGTDPACLRMDEFGQFSGEMNTDNVVGVLANFFNNLITP